MEREAGKRQDRGWEIPWWRFAVGLAVLVALWAGYYGQLRVHLPGRDGSPGGGALVLLLTTAVSGFTFLALVGLVLVGQAVHQRLRLAAFARGEAVLRDGAFGAVEGHVDPEGDVLAAPFSGERCLAYEYEVWVRASRPLRGRHEYVIGEEPGPQRTHLVGVAGIALAPTVIAGGTAAPGCSAGRRSTGASRRPGSYPGSDPGAARKVEGAPARAQLRARGPGARAGLRGTPVRPAGLRRAAAAAGLALRRARAGAPPDDLRVRERRVPLGSFAGACGLWSAERGGLHGRVGRVGLELWAGPIAEKQRHVLRQPLTTFVFSAFLALALHGVVALLWRSDAQLEALARERVAAGFQEAWQGRDLAGVQAALQVGVDPNQRDHYGNTLLMSAAWERDLAWVEALLAAGASVHPTNSAYGRNYTALTAAVMRGREDVVARLLTAGAADFRVTERNGRPLPPDGGPPLAAVSAYYQAMVDEDRAALDRLRLDPLDASYAIDWDLWRRVRPFAQGRARGFWNERAATLTLRAPDAHGRSTEWAYQLACVPATAGACEWRVEHEWEVAAR